MEVLIEAKTVKSSRDGWDNYDNWLENLDVVFKRFDDNNIQIKVKNENIVIPIDVLKKMIAVFE